MSEQNPKNILIPLKNAAYAMQIHESQLISLASAGIFSVEFNEKNEKCIEQSDLSELAASDKITEARTEVRKEMANQRAHDISTGKNEWYKNQTSARLEKLNNYIETIEIIHSKYHHKINILENETSFAAAYILFAKAISLLKMALLCIENGFWDSLIIIRSIEEATNIAEYFMVIQDTEKRDRKLHKWFRENKSPSNSECRSEIARFNNRFLPETSEEQFKHQQGFLYNLKSKPVHNTLNTIMEIHPFLIKNGELISDGFEYGSSNYPRKIYELTEFFRSSLLTTTQSLGICFQLVKILTEEDFSSISKIDKALTNLDFEK